MFAHFPPGMPGSLSWKAKALGADPYMFAMQAQQSPGTTGRQARFYLAITNHQRVRNMAKQGGLAQALSGFPPTI